MLELYFRKGNPTNCFSLGDNEKGIKGQCSGVRKNNYDSAMGSV